MPELDNDAIARELEMMGDLLEIAGADRFRSLSYHKAADSIRAWPEPLSVMADERDVERDCRGARAGEYAVPRRVTCGTISDMEPDLPRPSDQLPRSFFDRDPRVVARELLGCAVLMKRGGLATGGLIVETEAYLGVEDAGSHAATRGMTARNAVMYGPPGHVYVYFTYGNHHLLNFVCEPEGTAGAVLVRALEPVWGVAAMTARRGGRALGELANGPGKLTAALGVDLKDNACPLNPTGILVYGATSDPGVIGVSGRIGLANGYEHEYRYYLEHNPFVSRGRTGPVRGRRSAQDRSET